jgi:hypothetical protein
LAVYLWILRVDLNPVTAHFQGINLDCEWQCNQNDTCSFGKRIFFYFYRAVKNSNASTNGRMDDKNELIPKTSDAHSCPNCATEYTGNFCPNCGQSNSTFNRPFRFIVSDFAGNIFAFDTRLWNTIKTIFIKPGMVAQDIMEGKRERYMPPFRLYVFVSFIFFLMLNYSSISNTDIEIPEEGINLTIVNDSIEKVDSVGFELMLDSLNMDSVLTSPDMNTLGDSMGIDIEDIIGHPKRYYSQFLRWVSTAMFFLMPLYGFLLWVFFRKTQPHYFGHLLLAINQHVFTFLLLILLMAIHLIFPNNETSIGTWLVLSIPIYYVLGAHRLYGRKWTTVIMRLFVIGWIYIMITMVALLFLAGVTIME